MNNFHDLYANYYDDLYATVEPDTGMIQAPQPGMQSPDTGMIQAPPPATEAPGSGMVPPPPMMNQPGHSPDQIMYLMHRCMNNMMYVYTRNGESYWFYPMGIYQQTVNGYRWNPPAGWFSYSVLISSINDAFCYS